MSLVYDLVDSIVEFIECTFSKMVEGFSFLETLLGRTGSSHPTPSSAAADTSRPGITARDPGFQPTASLLASHSVQQLDTTTPEMTECECTTQLLVAENARLTRQQEQLQQIIADLSEYTIILERDVKISDRKASQLTRELHHHRKLTTSALAMYHSARHQLASAELRQSVALAYVDELMAKYRRRDICTASNSQTGTSSCTAPTEVFELEEL